MQAVSLFIATGTFFFVINHFIYPVSSLSVNTSIFYYSWYENPSNDGQWLHWIQNGHQPPDDIASNYYPVLGPFSSRNTSVMNQHMKWLRSANIGIIIVSWWGSGSHGDLFLTDLLNVAGDNGIKVAFHLEPYETRTSDTIKGDIEYILSKYGSHPAVFKAVRPTKWANSTLPRAVFYVYQSYKVSDSSWTAMLDSIRGTSLDVIVIGQSFDSYQIDSAHFDGLYTYDVYVINGSIFKTRSDVCKQNNAIYSASVGPGFIDIRAVGGSNRTKSRSNGQTYDNMWQMALDAQVEWVSITSFNEWHEGTQIEPATIKSSSAYDYMNFEGAYGKIGTEAQTAYLNQTAHWIKVFEG